MYYLKDISHVLLEGISWYVFTKYLVDLVVLNFFIWFCSTILLSKMKLLFFNLSTSPSVPNWSIDYGAKYELVYSTKNLR